MKFTKINVTEKLNNRGRQMENLNRVEEDVVEESYGQKKMRMGLKAYREIAGLSEDFQITEDNIDTYSLQRAASRQNLSVERLRNHLLGR